MTEIAVLGCARIGASRAMNILAHLRGLSEGRAVKVSEVD